MQHLHPDMYNRFYHVSTDIPSEGIAKYPPVACPMDAADLTCLRNRMPTRNTHSGVSFTFRLGRPMNRQNLAGRPATPSLGRTGLASLVHDPLTWQALSRIAMENEIRADLPGFRLLFGFI